MLGLEPVVPLQSQRAGCTWGAKHFACAQGLPSLSHMILGQVSVFILESPSHAEWLLLTWPLLSPSAQETTCRNYYRIKLKPDQFPLYLTSAEVGFSSYELVATPRNTSKGEPGVDWADQHLWSVSCERVAVARNGLERLPRCLWGGGCRGSSDFTFFPWGKNQ